MTDKKQPFDNDQPSPSEQASISATKTSPPKKDGQEKIVGKSSKASAPINPAKKDQGLAATKKVVSRSPQTARLSKVALVALVVAIIGITVSTVSYFSLNEQRLNVTNELIKDNRKNHTDNEQRVNKLLKEQQDNFSQQLQQMTAKVQEDSTKKITQLEYAVTRLERNKPSDWLIHEAEYLIRMAARTMWLERDTHAAIGLLKEADTRLTELNEPKFLPVRQLIHQDIEQLQLMPALKTDNVILSLMGLNRQLATLPLSLQQVSTVENDEAVFELSADINDWQENLAKTWRNFLDTFVVIHVRDGTAKPLLSPQYQQNLRENLSLQLQQAQWAARKEKSALYLEILAEIQTWLTQYFDMSEVSNQLFLSSIEQLKTELISFNYPSDLSSLSAIKNILTDNPLVIKKAENTPLLPAVNKEQSSAKEISPKESAENSLTIEEQIHKQTTLQQKADEKLNTGEDDI